MLFKASDLASITVHIHNWVLFLLWLHLFILSGVIFPLISSSILGTYRSGEFIFQCLIFLPFHTIHGVLKARILKQFAIPFSSGLCFFHRKIIRVYEDDIKTKQGAMVGPGLMLQEVSPCPWGQLHHIVTTVPDFLLPCASEV